MSFAFYKIQAYTVVRKQYLTIQEILILPEY